MRLIDVLKGAHDQVTQGATNIDTEITGLTCDSRRVEPGFLFAALPGSQADGRSFIPEALARGASAVLGPTGTAFDDAANVLLITDDNPRREYALMAARFFTGQPTTIAAVTGTNGKTSVVSFLRQLWARLGHRSASAGTLGIELAGFGGVKPDHEHDFNLTTPDPVDLHRSLSELCAAGVERLALEASSHGLQQCRLDGLRVTVAAFTNLTRDHLDYHGTMEDYLGAKLRLFSDVTGDDGVVVINADAAYSDAVEAASWGSGHRIMTYGQAGTDVRLLSVGSCAKGQHLNLEVAGDLVQVTLPLAGNFQASNALCALTIAIAVGDDPAAAARQLETLTGAPGRVQPAGRHPNGASVYVDYAHTPDALASVLKALRPHAAGRLHVVFGCGGDRDPGKRPEMGDIASKLADQVIVTDDNPRTEDPAIIRRQVLATCPGALEVDNRAEAISTAIDRLEASDLLVIAGKGHERGQIVGDEVHPFDDVDVVTAVIEGLTP